jgi:hypothetical protein
MNFDLNIQNYKMTELEEIFELPTNYDASIVEMKETKLRQNILSDSTIQYNTKTKTLQFLDDVKKMLITNLQKKTGPNGTCASDGCGSDASAKFGAAAGVGDLSASAAGAAGPSNIVATKSGMLGDPDSGSSLIQHKVDPYILANPSKYFKGTFNPLDKRIIKKSINVDTRFRDNYFSTQPSDFQVDLPIKFNNVVSMQLSAMELPTSFYNVDKSFGNNFFALVDLKQNMTQIITIPDGNYTYADLINEINILLYNVSNPFFANIVFTLDINRESGSGRVVVGLAKCEVNPGLPPENTFILNFQTDEFGKEDRTTPLPLKFGWMLGFRNGMYTNNITYISEGLIDLSAPRYVFLVIDDYHNSTNDGFYSVFSSSVLNKNILARISVRGNVFNYMAQNNLALTTNPREYFGPINLQKFGVQLLDEYGRILNLHNMDFSFCLTFDVLYDF